MTIKILPARLANQIAAGEVVERPASVVKELVENSLDSGATRIDIDIEKGGSKLIRVRDNGKGIVKDELALALNRHATSKIHSLDDLEAITSLGFRGEALASISAVSRLTLTSRTTTQDQAWSAYSEGRDMVVKLQPTAHPIGSTVEVLDLFFNTPARRKFLRTDKTEFTHIDELLKRIALSRFDVSINLKNNGKVVRQYRAAKNSAQTEKRITAVCGAGFVRHMLNIELEHNGLRLHGWITSPEGARQQNDLQYCYVNGRMMRDKLINHAIRQSYANSLASNQYASYVLFIEIDPHQVDVNVHPAKHEVRFHQGRLVHDFIYQALADSLAQSAFIDEPKLTASAYSIEQENSNVNQVMEAVEKLPAYPGCKDYQPNSETEKHLKKRNQSLVNNRERLGEQTTSNNQWTEPSQPSRVAKSNQHAERWKGEASSPSKREVVTYSKLLSTPDDIGAKLTQTAVPSNQTIESPQIVSIGKAFSVVGQQYLMTQSNTSEVLISLIRAEWYRILGQLQAEKYQLKVQPLLVPLSLKATKQDLSTYQKYHQLLNTFAIQLKEKSSTSIMVMGVPQPLRQQNLQQLIPDLLSYLAQQDNLVGVEMVSGWLADHITQPKDSYTLSEGIQLISELEQLWEGVLPLSDSTFVQSINFGPTISALTAN